MSDVMTLVVQPAVQLIALSVQSTQGPSGQPGPPGDSTPAHNFAYGDATPALIETIPAGSRLLSVQVFVDTAFNGTGAQISVGTLADPILLVDPALLDLSVAAQYEFYPQLVLGADTPIYLFITPGSGASQGAGSVIIHRQ